MRKIVMGVGVLVAFGLLAACPPRVQPEGGRPGAQPSGANTGAQAEGLQPDIELVDSKFDAGEVKQGDVITHTFVVKNRGLGELNIEKVKGS